MLRYVQARAEGGEVAGGMQWSIQKFLERALV